MIILLLILNCLITLRSVKGELLQHQFEVAGCSISGHVRGVVQQDTVQDHPLSHQRTFWSDSPGKSGCDLFGPDFHSHRLYWLDIEHRQTSSQIFSSCLFLDWALPRRTSSSPKCKTLFRMIKTIKTFKQLPPVLFVFRCKTVLYLVFIQVKRQLWFLIFRRLHLALFLSVVWRS